MEGDKSVYRLKHLKIKPDIIHPYTDDLKNVPIIIDNGSYNCRVGWAIDDNPRLVFRNIYARQRRDRGKKNAGESYLLVGNDITNIEAVRFQLRSPHDENVVTHFEGQELMLDYTFKHLGISSSSVDHPIVMTEALCNPNFSRQCMSELLFECYGVPKVSYAVDGMLSFHYNCRNEDGLLVNIGNCTTHVMPVINKFIDFERCRRIRVGGQQLTKYLWRWMQLRFPQHLNAITLSKAEEMLFSHMRVSEDYNCDISKWSDVNYYENNIRKIQLPYFSQPTNTLSAEQVKERRREAAKRLSEMNAKRREEKLEEDQDELARLIELVDAIEEFTPDEAEYQHALEEAQVSSLQELQKKIQQLQQKIEKTKLKINQANNTPFKDEDEEPKPKKFLESAPENREERVVWLQEKQQKWKDIHSRKASRRHHRTEMAKRRTAASQERMRIISQLAKREKKDDNFGMRDEDWDVYKTINKDGGGSDSEEDDEKLQELESILKHHDPEFLGMSSNSKKVSMAETYQLILSTEQIRIGEILFQPSICGLEQGGIIDTLEYVLGLYDASLQERLVSNVFVTGGGAQLPGIKDRLEREFLAFRPFKSHFNINVAKNPELDPWYGARSMVDELVDKGITRSQYDEFGADYIVFHRAGNRYWKPQIPQTITEGL